MTEDRPKVADAWLDQRIGDEVALVRITAGDHVAPMTGILGYVSPGVYDIGAFRLDLRKAIFEPIIDHGLRVVLDGEIELVIGSPA